jgi:hypothetical protein
MSHRFAELDQLKQNHPTWKGTPVAIIGLHHHQGVLKRCYVRKLNGRRNAWEGWVSVQQIEQQEVTASGEEGKGVQI